MQKADALEAAVDHHSERLSCKLLQDCTPVDAIQRTKYYVMQQAKTNSLYLSMPGVEPFSDDRTRQVHEQALNLLHYFIRRAMLL